MTRSQATIAFLCAALVGGCRREAKISSAALPDAELQSPVADAALGESVVPARCHATEKAAQLDDGRGLDDLEIGDGLSHAGGYAVGIVHRTSAGRQAAVALWGPAASDQLRIVDLAPTMGDAPPPRLASCGDELISAALALPIAGSANERGRSMARDLAVYRVDSQARGPAALRIPQKGDESLSFDIACAGASAIAVWGETDAGLGGEGGAAPAAAAPRGVVRGAVFGVGGHAQAPADLSPPDSNAEMPRVIPGGAGFLVFWLARRPDASRAADEPSNFEAIGEARTFGWLEVVAVDSTGRVVGPLRRLTAISGHVSAFDVLAHSDAAGKPGIFVVVRDDGESVDGAGGVLLRVRFQSEGAEPVELATDGLGRGAPTFVAGSSPWLTWVGPHEDPRLLPLDDAGEGIAPPSAEDGFEEARPLFASGQGLMLVASPRDKAAQLRMFACRR